MANEKRLIDANELLRDVDRYFFWSADEVKRFVATAHTVDAVEVVRCECCRSWSRHITNEKRGSCGCLPYHLCLDDVVTDHDFYCPYGERRKS